MQLGKLAADRAGPLAAACRGQLTQRGTDAAGCLEHDRPLLVRRDPLETLASLTSRPWQEALE